MAEEHKEARSWPTVLARLVAGSDLTVGEAGWAMDTVMSGDATPAQVAAFAIGLRCKGETSQEVTGMAAAMLGHSRRVDLDRPAVDVVGTGGDQAGTVNISTMAAIVAAAAGTPVVKHGNRAASSSCGAADVLEALGVAIELPPGPVRRCVDELGIGFCYAASYHPAFRHTSGPRRELGIPTTFNFLGPLTNPARPGAGLVGCASPRMAPVMAEVFAARGASVLLVRGDDGLDELTTATTSTVWVVAEGSVHSESFDPSRLGVAPASARELAGGGPAHNAQVVRDLLAGKPGPVRDAVLLNAAGALAAYHRLGADGDLHGAIGTEWDAAAGAIDSGSAAELLDRWIALSNELHDGRP